MARRRRFKRRGGYRRGRVKRYQSNGVRSGWRNVRLGSVANTAMSAARWGAAALAALNVELKSFDTSTGSFSFASTTSMLSGFTSIAAGDGDGQRDGQQCKTDSFYAEIALAANPAGSTSQRYRVIVFLDYATQSTEPAYTTLLAGAYPAVIAAHNLDWRKRFKVLADYKGTMTLSSSTAAKKLTFYKKLMEKLTFSDTTAAIPTNTAIYMLFASDQAANVPTANVVARLRFHDN